MKDWQVAPLKSFPPYFIVRFSGYSMYPTLRPGDRLVVRKIRNGLRRGDIVLLRSRDGALVAHRLVKALPRERWVTKGDSLLSPDPDTPDVSAMEGRVEAVVRGQRLIRLMTGAKSGLGGLYSILSLHNLTPGALRLKTRRAFVSRSSLHGASRPADVERRFVIAILGGCSHDAMKKARNVDWDMVLEIACREGVPGIVYHRIQDAGVPLDVVSVFKRLYQNIAALNLSNVNALERLEHALDGENLEIMTLKGTSLLDRVYPGIGMRPMGDMDLMVHPGDRGRFENVLYSLGYRKDRLSGHLFKRDSVVIDLHMDALNTDRIASRAALFPSGMEPVWANSLPWKEGCRRLRRPDDVDNLLLLSQHFMKHSFSSLIWLMDIYELLRDRDSRFWTRLSERADQLLQRRCLSYPLYLLNRLFGYEPPQRAGFANPTEALSRLERGILEAGARGQAMDRMGMFLALFCIPGLTNRIVFLRETLFPGRKVVQQEFSPSLGGGRASFYGYRLREAVSVFSRQCSTLLAALIRRSP